MEFARQLNQHMKRSWIRKRLSIISWQGPSYRLSRGVGALSLPPG